MIMTTNAAWAIGAGNLARRFFILDVDDIYVGDRGYFIRLREEMDNGGVEAMLDALNRIDLRGWHPQHDMPRTKALAEQQMISAKVFTRWGLDAFYNGGFMVKVLPIGFQLDTSVWSREHTSDVLAETVQQFASAAGLKGPVTSVGVGKWMSRCKFKVRSSNGSTWWTIPDRMAFMQAVKKEGGIT
jgi:hypothetical protein